MNKEPKAMTEIEKKVLRGYEVWEAELIADNRCWEPNGMASNPRLTNELYDKMMHLQRFRNQLLYPEIYQPIGPEEIEVLDKILEYKP